MVKYWILEVLIKQKTILKSFLTNKTNIKILNKNKNYQADILADFDNYNNFKKI